MNKQTLLVAAVFLFLLFHAAPLAAQNDTVAKVDEFIRAEMQRQKIPGVSLAVVKDGNTVLVKGYGLANVEHAVAVKPETVFQSGSVGKQFTAAAVMLLVEDGKINLDDKITKYFPRGPAAWQNVTVRHLLTHTAGFTDYPPDFDYRRDYTEAELLERIKQIPLAFQPGERWAYSNMGYVTLGIIIGRASGKFYGDFLQERVFRPLDMRTARIISEADIVPNRAAGYTLARGELRHHEWVSPTLNTTADGALYLTALDMVKWDAALTGEKLLRKSSLEQMWTPVRLNNGKTHGYGFGWSLGEVKGRKIIEHGGAWQGFKSFIARYPEDKLTVIVFANLSQTSEAKLAHGVAAIFNPDLAPPAAVAIEDKEPKTTAFVKEILQKMADGQLTAKMFTPEAAAQILQQAQPTADFLKSLGTLVDLQLIARETRASDGARIYRYRLTYRNEQENVIRLSVALTQDDKIAGINLRPD